MAIKPTKQHAQRTTSHSLSVCANCAHHCFVTSSHIACAHHRASYQSKSRCVFFSHMNSNRRESERKKKWQKRRDTKWLCHSFGGRKKHQQKLKNIIILAKPNESAVSTRCSLYMCSLSQRWAYKKKLLKVRIRSDLCGFVFIVHALSVCVCVCRMCVVCI